MSQSITVSGVSNEISVVHDAVNNDRKHVLIAKDLASLRRGHVGRQNDAAAHAAIGDDVK